MVVGGYTPSSSKESLSSTHVLETNHDVGVGQGGEKIQLTLLLSPSLAY
mgnify:CR=1